MKVMKFGGSSVKDAGRIFKVIEIVRQRLDAEPLAIVVSGFGGITNHLLRVSQMAASGDKAYQEELAVIQDRHLEAVQQLIPVRLQSPVFTQVKLMLNELEDLLYGVFLLGEISPRSLDMAMSFGERLSSRIVAAGFQAHGIAVELLDSRSLIRTDASYNNAIVDFEKTNANLRAALRPEGGPYLLPGFIASGPDGQTTTIGRDSSDYTAAIVAAALGSRELQIWTDVDGMMTANPHLVSKALLIEEISYAEALELSHFGSKVINPHSIVPALSQRIPILIKNSYRPEQPGTLISDKPSGRRHAVTGISSIDSISLITVQGGGMVGVVGIATRVFGAVARKSLNVILITQGSSEHSITFAVSPVGAVEARQALEQEFALELRHGLLDPIQVESELSVLAVVGEKMRDTPGISARLFAALGRNGISAIATAQGASELNISVVIRREHQKKALNAIHESFFLSETRTLDLFVVGTGVVGRTVLRQIAEQRDYLARRNAIEIRLVGVSNSRKMLLNSEGISLDDWENQLQAEGERADMAAFVERMKRMNLRNSVFVDNTAHWEVAQYYREALDANISVVTPNKVANARDRDDYQALQRSASRYGVRFLYETNVGAGLPVIGTLKDLIRSGDEILKIEAILSGSLNFIFSNFAQKGFYPTVLEAKRLGYTEPDPRLDLSGMDVARKILILSREVGAELNLADLQVQSCLGQESQSAANMDEFWQQLEQLDAPRYDRWSKEAEARGKRLKYVARYEQGRAMTQIMEVGPEHPFYNVSGSDNIVAFTTRRYFSNPLVVIGPGAGAEVTAAGVFADIVRIVADL